MRRFLIGLVFLMAMPALADDLPNQPPLLWEYDNGLRGLEHWSIDPPNQDVAHSPRITPDNPSFEGAVLWWEGIKEPDPVQATLLAAKGEGMRDMRVLKVTQVQPEMVTPIDPYPGSKIHFVTIEGTLDGAPARGVFMNWYGVSGLEEGEGPLSGVHAFVAPVPVFEAMGGWAVLAIRFLEGTSARDLNMLEDGTMSVEEAHQQLATFYVAWAVNYLQNQMLFNAMLGQTMAIHQQTLNSMQSYNNALSQCGGLGCSMSMGADGSWSLD